MAQASYRLPSREKRETLLGLTLPQLLAVVGGLLGALWVFVAAPEWGLAKEAGAVILLTAGAALAFVPVGHYSLIEWLPTIAGWWLRERRHQVPADTLLFEVTPTGLAITQRPLPRGCGKVEILEASRPDCPAFGVLHDFVGNRRIVTLRVKGTGFSLSEAEEQARRIARWGELLATLGRASTAIDRVQWIETAAPEDGAGPKRYFAEGAREVPDPLLRSYLHLVEGAGTTTEHETLLAFGINLGRLRQGRQAAEGVLVQHVSNLMHQLEGDVQVEGVLPPRSVALALRTAFDPLARLTSSRAERAGWPGGVEPNQVWPLRVVEHLGHLEMDGWLHASYRVVGLPRSPVGPTFAAPLLLQTGCYRRIAVTMEVAPPLATLRRVERRRAMLLVNQSIRARMGFLTSATEELRAEETEMAAKELAEGHVLARCAIVIVVSGRELEELEEACREVEQQAALAGIELQRCWGEQLRAFWATLPLCRGLPERRR